MGLVDRLAPALHAAREAEARAVLEEARKLAPKGSAAEQAESRRRYGKTLAESGHIEREGAVTLVVFDVPYAAKLHESQHLRHPDGGQAKFLEAAVKGLAPHFERLVAGEVHALVSSAVRGAERSRRGV